MPTLMPRDWRGHDWLWRLLAWAIPVGVLLVTGIMALVWWWYR